MYRVDSMINIPLTVSIRPDAPILAPSIWRKFIGFPIIDLSIPPGFLPVFGGSKSKSHFETYSETYYTAHTCPKHSFYVYYRVELCSMFVKDYSEKRMLF